MSLETYREALADAVSTIDGLRCTPYLTDQVNPPHAMIDLEVNYDLTFARGADVLTVYLMVFDQRKSERSAQIRLDDWRDGSSTTSIKYVVENDTTLATKCDYTRVVSAGRPTVVTVGTVDYLMVEFQLEAVL